MRDVTWRPEDPAGHNWYCVHPEDHSSVTTYCSADPSEPQTMDGLPSRAWLDAHRMPSAGDRVTDVRHGVGATVVMVDYRNRGGDGYGIVVMYDDEPDVPVSTGTDYFTVEG